MHLRPVMPPLEPHASSIRLLTHTNTSSSPACPQIYLEPIGVRHYARWLSSAVFLRTIGILGAIVLSFTLAYTSGGIWLKAKTLYEQPGVTFNYGMLVILEVRWTP